MQLLRRLHDNVPVAEREDGCLRQTLVGYLLFTITGSAGQTCPMARHLPQPLHAGVLHGGIGLEVSDHSAASSTTSIHTRFSGNSAWISAGSRS